MATATATLARRPLFMQAASGDVPATYGLEYDGFMMRLFVGAIWPRTGIVTNDAMFVTQTAAGAGWSIDIGTGFAVCGVTDGTEPDKYLVYQGTTPFTVPLTGFTTNPAGLRTHKVWLAVFDKQKKSAGLIYEAQIMVTEDTGSGAPTPTSALFPGLANVMQLATVTITTGQSSILNANIVNSVRHANFGGSHTSVSITANIVDASATLALAAPKAIRSGTTVKLQGAFRRSTLTDFAAGATYNLGTLPAALAPVNTRIVVAPAGASTGAVAYTYRLTISTSGALQADIPTGYNPNWLGLDGVNYEID